MGAFSCLVPYGCQTPASTAPKFAYLRAPGAIRINKLQFHTQMLPKELMRLARLTVLLSLVAPLFAQGAPETSTIAEVPSVEHTGISNYANPRLTLINWENQVPFGHEGEGKIGSSTAAVRQTETSGASSRTAREGNRQQARASSKPTTPDETGNRREEGYVRLGTNESTEGNAAARHSKTKVTSEPVSSRTPPWSANNTVAVSDTPGTDVPTPLVVFLILGGILALYLLKNSLFD